MTDHRGPVLIEIDEEARKRRPFRPPPPRRSMTTRPCPKAARCRSWPRWAARRRGSWLARWFWGGLVALLGFVLSVAAWDFATRLLAANPVLGWIATALIAIVLVTLLLIALRELAAFSRLGRLDALHRDAEAALAPMTSRPRAAWSGGSTRSIATAPACASGGRRCRAAATRSSTPKASSRWPRPADGPARCRGLREVEAAARQVATVTALVPLAFADVIAALTSNLRMIRRIAEVYGGRAGTLGAWRLTRAVLTHLVATGAVAVGDDLIGSVAGGSVLSRVSRRFGEGVVNGALTARVGVAAMEVCRPLPFGAGKRPP
jgi:putative membrane protein